MPDMLVRLKKGKTTYEVMVHEGMVKKFREGSVNRLDDVFVTPIIFVNASKGQKASTEQLKNSFETEDEQAVIETIVRTGEAQESAGERKGKMDAKRQEIINVIQKNYVAPNGSPLPLVRIENALAQTKPRIDVDVEATRQVTAMFAKLKAVMPMKKGGGGMEGTVSVPTTMAGAVSGVVRKHATLQRETFGARAKYDLQIHAYDALMKDLARVTKGDFEFTLVSQVPVQSNGAAPAEGDTGGGRKKKGKGKGKKK